MEMDDFERRRQEEIRRVFEDYDDESAVEKKFKKIPDSRPGIDLTALQMEVGTKAMLALAVIGGILAFLNLLNFQWFNFLGLATTAAIAFLGKILSPLLGPHMMLIALVLNLLIAFVYLVNWFNFKRGSTTAGYIVIGMYLFDTLLVVVAVLLSRFINLIGITPVSLVIHFVVLVSLFLAIRAKKQMDKKSKENSEKKFSSGKDESGESNDSEKLDDGTMGIEIE